jgi:hypothetical protein
VLIAAIVKYNAVGQGINNKNLLNDKVGKKDHE